MMDYQHGGRDKQKRRTRKAVLMAARELICQGQTPSVTEAADAADVSRRTAYRYFPTQEQLLTEAMLEEERPVVEHAFEAADLANDVEARLDVLVHTLYKDMRTTEPLLRAMVRLTLKHSPDEPGDEKSEMTPRRGYRRIEWIELALSPVREQLDEARFERLVSAIAVCIGIESVLVLCDIRGLDLAAAEDVSRWSTKMLLRAALTEQLQYSEKRSTDAQ